jgi:hypothetical protein
MWRKMHILNQMSAKNNLALILFLLVYSWFYLSGFRTTADEMAFHGLALDGFGAVWAETVYFVFWQGKIGHFLGVPIGLYASYLAEYSIVRLLFVIFHFISYMIFAYYVCYLFRVKYFYLLSVCFISIHPLLFSHTPPNTYPLIFSLPFSVILALRIYWIKADANTSIRFICGLLLVIAAIIHEYAIIFLMALLMLEWSVSIIINKEFKFQKSISDLIPIIFVVGIYVGFRYFFPSSYEGNQIPRSVDFFSTAYTLISQLWLGTIFPYLTFDRNFIEVVWISAIAAVLCWITIGRLQVSSDLRNTFFMFLICFICTIFVMLPNASNARLQSWCLIAKDCVYVNSRMGYYFLIPALIFGLFFILKLLMFRRSENIIMKILATLVAFLAVYPDWKMEKEMRDYTRAYKDALYMHCKGFDRDRIASMLVRGPIVFHENYDKAGYWRKYMDYYFTSVNCSNGDVENSQEVYFLTPGLFLADKFRLYKFFGSGWSIPESWGVWSQQRDALIYTWIPANVKTATIEIDAIGFSSSEKNQTANVYFGQVYLGKIELSRSRKIFNFEVNSPKEGENIFKFVLDQPISPRSLGLGDDNRSLGIGIYSVRLSVDY